MRHPKLSHTPLQWPTAHVAACRACAVLLDAPPKADGSWDARVAARLEAIGHWLHTFGAGVYATRPWVTFGEGPTTVVPGDYHEWPLFTASDFRYTRARDGRVCSGSRTR